MKRFFKYITVFTLIVLSMSLAVGCSKKKAEEPIETEDMGDSLTDDENNNPDDLTDNEDNENGDLTDNQDTLGVELGNDIGKDITKLYLRADENDNWNEIKLTGNLWRSGYLIPIELEASELPAPADGWEIRVEFSDGTEQLFTGVDLNNQSTIILTADGPVY